MKERDVRWDSYPTILVNGTLHAQTTKNSFTNSTALRFFHCSAVNSYFTVLQFPSGLQLEGQLAIDEIGRERGRDGGREGGRSIPAAFHDC